MNTPNQIADERTCGHGRVPARHEVITVLEDAYRSAVQRVINQFQGDVQAMAIEIVRLRDELMASEA